jgi:AcrR family transcriptional regulator
MYRWYILEVWSELRVAARDKRRKDSKLARRAADTRRRLLEAALELLPKHSFHTLSLDMIAAHVGMTKGAIYGSFPSKYALIAEALGTQPGLRPDRLAWPKSRRGSVRERMRRLADVILAAVEESSALAPASSELVRHTFTDDEERQRRVLIGAEMRLALEEKILGLFAPEELPMTPRAFALLLSVLVPGLMFGRAYEGSAVDDETVRAIFDGLAAAAAS